MGRERSSLQLPSRHGQQKARLVGVTWGKPCSSCLCLSITDLVQLYCMEISSYFIEIQVKSVTVDTAL